MPVEVNAEFPLPNCWTAPAFSTDPSTYLGEGGPGWKGLQESIFEVLEEFRLRIELEATAYVCSVARPEDRFAGPPQIGLLLAYEGEVSHVEIGTLKDSLEQDLAVWASEGTREIPRRAFPTVALLGGRRHQIWERGERGLYARSLRLGEGILSESSIVAEVADPFHFVDGVAHAVAVEVPSFLDEAPLCERLKVAFALNVCERIVEADGRLRSGEMEFLRRVFPVHRLDTLGLTDRAEFLALRQQAVESLPVLLSDDEKLALMGLFYRVSQSDGEIAPTEVDVLRGVAAQLEVPWEQVEEYLRHLW